MTALLTSHIQYPTQNINTVFFMELLGMSDMTLLRHVCLTIFTCAVPLAISLFTQDLGMVFNITGAYTATMLGYIFPSALYLAAYKDEFRDIVSTWSNLSLWGKICSIKAFYLPCVVIVLGVLIIVGGIASIVQNS